MNIEIIPDRHELGVKSALAGAHKIKKTIRERGSANIILATGSSQFETLKNLVRDAEIDWACVIMFHLDEYAGIPGTHPASFRRYLKERFTDKIADLKAAHFIQADSHDIVFECKRLDRLISEHPIDVAFVGIGENGHLAFNDPPADFETEKPYLVVKLDEACRRQQMGEGWFDSMKEVPKTAVSMSIKQIMKSEHIICSVPDQRKAPAVRDCLSGKVSNLHPASILQNHSNCTIFLDQESASLLSSNSGQAYQNT